MNDMAATHPTPSLERRPRIWPGVLIVALLWLITTVPGKLEAPPMIQFFALFWGPMLAMLGITVWWLFASRLHWVDRLGILLACAAVMTGAALLAHGSVTSNRGMPLIIYGLPILATAWVGWLLLSSFLSWPARRVGLVVVFLLVAGVWDGARLDGMDGAFAPEFSLRWNQTGEEKSIAEINAREPAESMVTKRVELTKGDWPGFRGPNRDGRLIGFRIATDWKANPPKELWRQRIGPGWSSFAVIGDRLYTQEQRIQDELVVCYHADTGAELWKHKDTQRFNEAVGGPGPRATPTFHDGKIYALGAKGTLNCLDAATGKPIWSKDIAADSGAKEPQWGFSASPLVAKGIVSVYAGGKDKAVLGYKADTGELAWASGTGEMSYCSTQLSRIDGVEQLLVATGSGLTALDPETGKILQEYADEQKGMARVVQPAVVSATEVLLGTGFGKGTKRLKLTKSPGGSWSTEEVWSSLAISPYFNDLVVEKGNLYGFDGIFFTCVNLDEGERKWRARGYGSGQVLLLADQDLLLVLSEKGDVSLLEATPKAHTVLGKFKAITGKTWNHPVIAGGKLFVRNGEEMACFRLAE